MKGGMGAAILLLGMAAPTTVSAQLAAPTYIVSVQPALDIPFPGDDLLFQNGGGFALSASRVSSFFRAASMGLELGYHLVPLQPSELSDPGSLSLLSGSVVTALRFLFLRRLELCLFAAGGGYFAFLNDDPSAKGGNFYIGGGIGLSFRIARFLSLGIQTRYNNFLGLHHHQSIAFSADFRFGG